MKTRRPYRRSKVVQQCWLRTREITEQYQHRSYRLGDLGGASQRDAYAQVHGGSNDRRDRFRLLLLSGWMLKELTGLVDFVDELPILKIQELLEPLRKVPSLAFRFTVRQSITQAVYVGM